MPSALTRAQPTVNSNRALFQLEKAYWKSIKKIILPEKKNEHFIQFPMQEQLGSRVGMEAVSETHQRRLMPCRHDFSVIQKSCRSGCSNVHSSFRHHYGCVKVWVNSNVSFLLHSLTPKTLLFLLFASRCPASGRVLAVDRPLEGQWWRTWCRTILPKTITLTRARRKVGVVECWALLPSAARPDEGDGVMQP